MISRLRRMRQRSPWLKDISPSFASMPPHLSQPRSRITFAKSSSSMHKLLRRLSTPEKIQRYLDDLPYNKERAGETCRSPRLAIEFNTAHCFEGALLAAAAL